MPRKRKKADVYAVNTPRKSEEREQYYRRRRGEYGSHAATDHLESEVRARGRQQVEVPSFRVLLPLVSAVHTRI